MNKAFILLLLLVFLISPILAYDKDVAYVTESRYTPHAEFIAALNELGLTYDTIYSANFTTTNFSNYRMMIVNPDYFTYPDRIPVNNIPALVVNGENLASWGWCKYISTTSQDDPFHLDLLINHSITKGINGTDVQVYNSATPQLYYVQQVYSFSGTTLVASMKNSPTTSVIAYAEPGDVLTRSGYPNTNVNARTVFFGITASSYWTNDTKKLFKNSIMWVLAREDYSLNLNQGVNLISIPVITNSISVASLMSQYPQITDIKTFNNTIVSATNMDNQKGYFIYANSSFLLNISGETPTADQTINLKSGMNLVGFNGFNNITLTSLPSQIVEVSKRNMTGNYNIATKHGGLWFNAFNLEPGKAYWIKANADVVWTYSP